jgi:hypothetical protein
MNEIQRLARELRDRLQDFDSLGRYLLADTVAGNNCYAHTRVSFQLPVVGSKATHVELATGN